MATQAIHLIKKQQRHILPQKVIIWECLISSQNTFERLLNFVTPLKMGTTTLKSLCFDKFLLIKIADEFFMGSCLLKRCFLEDFRTFKINLSQNLTKQRSLKTSH
jgi:hypothetical protein